ncbi:MAG: hypothetical protein HY369_02680 [Candidatus Aenigmarchaeota archaeon]|nr:hypothetical protein [Candidatus Aenigmarchaeota archaeon]
MKAQMFILTLVFLAGLVFVVQASLAQYGAVSLEEPFDRQEASLIAGVVQAFNETLWSSPTCSTAEQNVASLETFVEEKLIQGVSLTVETGMDCASWGTGGPVLNLTVRLKSATVDIVEQASLPGS